MKKFFLTAALCVCSFWSVGAQNVSTPNLIKKIMSTLTPNEVKVFVVDTVRYGDNETVIVVHNTDTIQEPNNAVLLDSAMMERLKMMVRDKMNYRDEIDKIKENLQGSEEPEKGNVAEKGKLFDLKMILIIVLFLAFAGYVFWKEKWGKKRIRDVVKRDCRSWVMEVASGVVMSNAPSVQRSYDSDIRELKHRVEKLENGDGIQQGSKSKVVQREERAVPKNGVLYSSSIVNGAYHRPQEQPDVDTIFELRHDGGSKATVTIYGNAYNKILTNPSFLEGCEKQVLGHTKLTVTQEGSAIKDANGKWEVRTPIKVEIR